MDSISYNSNGVLIESSRRRSDSNSSACAVTAVIDRRDCCGRSNSRDSPEDPSEAQALLLRISGILCVILGASEIGTAASIFTAFSDDAPGSWWSVIMVILAGNRLFNCLEPYLHYSKSKQ